MVFGDGCGCQVDKGWTWWLILCVNLTGLRDDQIASEILILGVSVRAFAEDTSIGISRLSKKRSPLSRGWASSNPCKAGNRTERQRKCKFPLFA